jgi:uncharacterized membrane protein
MTAIALSAIGFALVAWTALPRWDAVAAAPSRDLVALAAAMIAAGVAGGVSTLAAQAAMGRGNDASAWTVSQSSLVVPALAGICLRIEPPTVGRAGGVAAVMAGLVCISRASAAADGGSASGDRRWLGFAVLAFLGGGAQQVLSILPSWWPGWHDATDLRVPLLATGSATAFAVALVASGARPTRADCAWAAAMALNTLVSQVVFFAGLDRLQAPSVGFPLAIGACIVAFAAWRALAQRERLGGARALGIACSVAGVLGLALA